jgi:hypothetical protein
MRNLGLIVSLVFAVGGWGQSPPNFSGTWRLDLARSDAAAHAETPGPITVSIKQSDKQIHVTTTTSRGTSDQTYMLVPAEAPPIGSGANARWQGDALVTNAVRDIRGQSVTVQQSRRLSADGNEMIVESIVNVQHGYSARDAQVYGASRDVYVRVKTP